MRPKLRVDLLGSLALTCEGRTLRKFRTQKTAALCAFLAYHPRRDHPREALCDILWPQESREAGGANLSTSLWWLRRELSVLAPNHADLLVADRHTVRLNLEEGATDVSQFEAALPTQGVLPAKDRLEALRRVCDVYSGELLPGHFEDWVLVERRRLAAHHFQAARELIHSLEQSGLAGGAVEAAIRLVALDPFREEAHYELIRAYLAAGQPASAWGAYRDLEALLRQEYHSSPSPATQALLSGTKEAEPASDLEDSTAAAASLPAMDKQAAPLQPPGGALPVDCPYYAARDTDRGLFEALDRGESIVLVKGGRQMGKSSLLARGLAHARAAGASVLSTDFEALAPGEMESPAALYLSLANRLALQLNHDAALKIGWAEERSPGANFERFVRRELLSSDRGRFVWALDGVDRLFTCGFGDEIFRLLRSWHNARALDPEGPWSRLTLVIAYATDVHRFIRDPNQSPFNVGTHLVLAELTASQLRDLNERFLFPLRTASERLSFLDLVGGHPYLLHRGLFYLRTTQVGFSRFLELADRDEGPFGSHLRALHLTLSDDGDLLETVRGLVAGNGRITPEAFYRLRTAGVVEGESERAAVLRCSLYKRYFARHLAVSDPSPSPFRKRK